MKLKFFLKNGTLLRKFKLNETIKRSTSNLSYIHCVGSEPLKPITIGVLLENVARKYDNREALVSLEQNKRISYRTLLEQADAFAAGLMALGLKQGDRVGIWAPNIIEWAIVYFACARGGFILTAINSAYQPKELEYCINKVGIKTLICIDEEKRSNYLETVKKISPSILLNKSKAISCSQLPSLRNIVVISENTYDGTYNYHDIKKMGSENIDLIKKNQHKINPDSGSNIQFTSGTTGNPKANLASHFNIVNNSFYISKRMELDKKYHRSCIQGPLFHALASTIGMMSAIHFGSTIVFAGSNYSREKTLKTCSEEGCTTTQGTPTMFLDMVTLQKEKKKKLCLENVMIGGAPCSPKLLKEMKEVLGLKHIHVGYGMTETSAITFLSLPTDINDDYKFTQTVGHVAEHIEVKVVDEDGNMVPMGKMGELYVRGYCNTLGYWDDEEKSKELIGRDRWLRTGDKFILQENGYGKIVGRVKDLIIRGGENIFPKELEDFLNMHPNIIETQVIGVSHERLGEEICACVRIKNGSKLTLNDLQEFCKGKIAYFKIPSRLEILDEFPKTKTGKIQKFMLKKMFEK